MTFGTGSICVSSMNCMVDTPAAFGGFSWLSLMRWLRTPLCGRLAAVLSKRMLRTYFVKSFDLGRITGWLRPGMMGVAWPLDWCIVVGIRICILEAGRVADVGNVVLSWINGSQSIFLAEDIISCFFM